MRRAARISTRDFYPKGMKRRVEGTSFSFTPAATSWSRISTSGRPASFCPCSQKHLSVDSQGGLYVVKFAWNARCSIYECSRALLSRARRHGQAAVSERPMVLDRCSGCAHERARVPRERQVRTHAFLSEFIFKIKALLFAAGMCALTVNLHRRAVFVASRVSERHGWNIQALRTSSGEQDSQLENT